MSHPNTRRTTIEDLSDVGEALSEEHLRLVSGGQERCNASHNKTSSTNFSGMNLSFSHTTYAASNTENASYADAVDSG